MKRLVQGEAPYGISKPSKYKPRPYRTIRVPIIPIEEASGEEAQGWLFEEDDEEGTIRAVH